MTASITMRRAKLMQNRTEAREHLIHLAERTCDAHAIAQAKRKLAKATKAYRDFERSREFNEYKLAYISRVKVTDNNHLDYVERERRRALRNLFVLDHHEVEYTRDPDTDAPFIVDDADYIHFKLKML